MQLEGPGIANERKWSRLACRDDSSGIGHLENTVINCSDLHALAEFYCQMLGMRINEDIEGWMVPAPGVASSSRPVSTLTTGFRQPSHTVLSQQMHLNIRVSDANRAERELIVRGPRALGATGAGFRVFADRVRQPFGIILVTSVVIEPDAPICR